MTSRRPATAPSSSSYNCHDLVHDHSYDYAYDHAYDHAYDYDIAHDQSNKSQPIKLPLLPILPPIPYILSHAPTRSHLFKHLLRLTLHSQLSQLILLLDLLAILRGHASQTSWSFDDPSQLPSIPAPFLQTQTQTQTQSNNNNNNNKPKSRLRIRPGTSDGLQTSTTSRLRQHTRSHIFRSIVTHPTNPNNPPSNYNSLLPTHSNPIIENHHHQSNTPSNIRPTQPPWLIHLIELYKPPQVDLDHGWFVPLPLHPQSLTFQSLAKQLSSNTNVATAIAPAIDALKQVGQLACQELSELESVRDWWSQHSSHLWPHCSRQQKCQSFNDLLSLWPSLHFPTPSLSQLYKISNHLSKTRTRFRLTESPSPDAISNYRSFHSQATLRGLYEIYLGPPSSNDLELIEKLLFHSRATPLQADLAKSFSVPTQPFVQPHSRSSVLPPSRANVPLVSPFRLHSLPESEDVDVSPNSGSQQPKSKESRSQKLRQFFGHEVDSILPPSSCQERYNNTEPGTAYPDQQPSTSCFSTYTISNISVSLAPTPIRRKSTTSPVEFDRPRKRSSIATIDISLATLTTSSHTEVESPATPRFSDNTSFPHHSSTRLTVVGTSPTNSATFLGSSQPHTPTDYQLSPTRRTRPNDYSNTQQLGNRTFDDSITEELDETSCWSPEQRVRDAEAIQLKRMTKLEKILGEPLESSNPTPSSTYGVLGVQVVREVVEDVEIHDGNSNDYDVSSGRRGALPPSAPSNMPYQHHKTHSRSSSASQPSTFFDISRDRLPNCSTCSFHHSPSSRPSTAQSETVFDGTSSKTRPTAKRRLGKLQKFLGDVTHHPKRGSSEPTESKARPLGPPTRTGHDDMPSLFPTTTKVTHQCDRKHANKTHVKKPSSFFKFSSSPSASSASSTTGGGGITTTENDISDESHSRGGGGLRLQPPNGPSHGPSSATHLSPLSQYSHRSARKLEKLLGEHIPRHVHERVGNSSSPQPPAENDFIMLQNHHNSDQIKDKEISSSPYIKSSNHKSYIQV